MFKYDNNNKLQNDLATKESFRDLTPYKESDLDLEQGVNGYYLVYGFLIKKV